VVKATGEGVAAGLARVRVSRPDQAPRLLGYPGRPGLAAALYDLAPGPGHAGALCVLTRESPTVAERWYGY
jgi:hypothetical protein